MDSACGVLIACIAAAHGHVTLAQGSMSDGGTSANFGACLQVAIVEHVLWIYTLVISVRTILPCVQPIFSCSSVRTLGGPCGYKDHCCFTPHFLFHSAGGGNPCQQPQGRNRIGAGQAGEQEDVIYVTAGWRLGQRAIRHHGTAHICQERLQVGKRRLMAGSRHDGCAEARQQ